MDETSDRIDAATADELRAAAAFVAAWSRHDHEACAVIVESMSWLTLLLRVATLAVATVEAEAMPMDKFVVEWAKWLAEVGT